MTELKPKRIWWKHGVVYHIYPRSFQDTNGDGIGDLPGIIQRLDYLKFIGVEAIWLSPVYNSPLVDFGYDVSDYQSIDPSFGSLDDFLELIRVSHQKGIRVIMDMILNHTSDQHPWFVDSASSVESPRRNWYIWRPGREGCLPNNWKSAVGGSSWSYHQRTQSYYLHSFFPEQPDLNWREPAVEEAFQQILKFWLDLGADGFRFDVINMIGKDKKFRNNPLSLAWPGFQSPVFNRNRKLSLKVVKRIRALLDSYESKVSIGEIYAPPPGDSRNAAKYLLNGDNGLHLAFDFSLIFSIWGAGNYYRAIKKWYKSLPEGGWPCLVLSNHDLMRHIDRYPWRSAKVEKARICAVLLLTLKGTPFLYYGEEIGMGNLRLPRSEIQDPVGKRYWPLFTGRDGARTPMQWENGQHGGFSEVKPWLPLSDNLSECNVDDQMDDPGSLLSLYRKLMAIRKKYLSLEQGAWIPSINGKDGILAYYRRMGEERIFVVLNFTRRPKVVSISGEVEGRVLVSSCRKENEIMPFGNLRALPYEATVFLIA